MDLLKCIVGPSLVRIYKHGARPGVEYEENILENISSKMIGTLRSSFSLCYYFSPIVFIWMYRRQLLTTTDGLQYMLKFTGTLLVIYATAKFIRGVGRYNNDLYRQFISDLSAFNNKRLDHDALRKYEFGISHIPADFSLSGIAKRESRLSLIPQPPPTMNSPVHVKILSYIAASSFARWLIYPGSTALLNAMIEMPLNEGRKKLIEERGGKRYKLETSQGNIVDSLFIDKRHTGTETGNTLVICSEGNAAFYEAGCLEAPYKRGYSVLGWNAPGFGASTGSPYPQQVQTSVDTVVQFALTQLNFTIEQIVFFSWSIGGYATGWAAAHYPQCKAVILDATFDNISLLAKQRMPVWLARTVEDCIQNYFNLNNSYWINNYNGPLRLIRRTQDEMISSDSNDMLLSNRGNYLLLDILKYRYPFIINSDSRLFIGSWLTLDSRTHNRDLYLEENSVDKIECMKILTELTRLADISIPLSTGAELSDETKIKLGIFLADAYMSHMESSHCVPLNKQLFELPWQIPPV